MITAFLASCGDRCVRISELEGKRVAIWGYGREGRAALAALRWRLPRQPVTVFCSPDEAEPLREMQDPALRIEIAVDADALCEHDVVVKSPGISPYTSPAADAALEGVRFVGGTGLWFGEDMPGRRIGVTGSKGKSTTTAFIAHLPDLRQAFTALRPQDTATLAERLPAPCLGRVPKLKHASAEAVAEHLQLDLLD